MLVELQCLEGRSIYCSFIVEMSQWQRRRAAAGVRLQSSKRVLVVWERWKRKRFSSVTGAVHISPVTSLVETPLGNRMARHGRTVPD
jgi:hypothetical protein